MGKIKNGILGAVSGKVGPVIGGMWKTIAYIKALPRTKRKRSVKQIATQEKMRFMNKFLVPFHPYINVGLKNEATSQTEISAAFTANYHETIVGVHPHLSVDLSKFIFSKGDLPMPPDMAATLVDNTVQFTWKSSKQKWANFDDQLMIVLYDSHLHKATGFTGGVNRNANTCSFELKDSFIGKALHVYASMISWDRKRIANNVYLGNLRG